MNPSLLYLVFHGLTGLVHHKPSNRLRALLFDMDDHRVAAGHWLTEHDIPWGAELACSGIADTGTKFLDGRINPIVNDAILDPRDRIFAQIDLPLPEKIFSLRRTDLRGKVQGETGKLSSLVYSAVQVLQYELTAPNFKMQGGGFSFVAESATDVPGVGGKLAVVHVLNEPEEAVTDEHAKAEFSLGAAAFGADLTLTDPPVFPDGTGDVRPPGLLAAETLPLSRRDFSVNVLVAKLRGTEIGDAESIGGNKVCGTVSAIVR